MITAVIVEDEKSSMEYLLSLLAKSYSNIQVMATASNVDDAVTIIKKNAPDIVFLDIELQDGTSFEVLDNLGQHMPFEIIFTTGFLDYKERAMDYFAFYYLNKPVQEVELKKVLDMYFMKRTSFDVKKYVAFKNQIQAKNQIISVIIKDEYIPIELKDIIFCEASGSYTFIHTINGDKLLTTKNLKRIEDLIENEAFYRVHRSKLVNMEYISSISKGGIIRMCNNVEITTSVRSKKKVIDTFQLYLQTKP
ncbi:LytR/AlgR family response regulator transcription factor [Kordia jejudonensis]|uniref:LytR/AlgR family response regulator transcription factor n=1 Tax=Kordia jejudonensis TaxID=1348245 RepID=UPI0006297741|nr:LytTR family DNA-binding domain-containing protein [Kordia jejudonensis]